MNSPRQVGRGPAPVEQEQIPVMELAEPYGSAQEMLGGEGINAPTFGVRLEPIKDNLFGSTRALPSNHPYYQVDTFIEHAVQHPGGDYLLTGIDGRGVSHAFHYFLVRDEVACFIKNPVDLSPVSNKNLQDMQGLLDVVDRIKAAGRWPAGQRLIVEANGVELRGRYCFVIPGGEGAPDWQDKIPQTGEPLGSGVIYYLTKELPRRYLQTNKQ